jgi:hypothetical protein
VVIKIESRYFAMPILFKLLCLFSYIHETTDKKESIVELIAPNVLMETNSTLYKFHVK